MLNEKVQPKKLIIKAKGEATIDENGIEFLEIDKSGEENVETLSFSEIKDKFSGKKVEFSFVAIEED